MTSNNMSKTNIDAIVGSINNAVGEGVSKALQPLVEKIKYSEKCYNYVQEMLMKLPEYNKLLQENKEMKARLGIGEIKINIHEKKTDSDDAVSISSLYNEYDIHSEKNQIKLVETDNIEGNSKIVARIHDFNVYLSELRIDRSVVKYYNDLFKDILSIMPDTESDISNITVESYDDYADSPTMNKIAKNLIVSVKTSKPVSKENAHSVKTNPVIEAEDVKNYKKNIIITSDISETKEEKTPHQNKYYESEDDAESDQDAESDEEDDFPENPDDTDAEEFPVDEEGFRINYSEDPKEYMFWYKNGVERWRMEQDEEEGESVPVKPRKAVIENVDKDNAEEDEITSLFKEYLKKTGKSDVVITSSSLAPIHIECFKGNIDRVREMMDEDLTCLDTYTTGCPVGHPMNNWRALEFAKAGGHDELVAIVEDYRDDGDSEEEEVEEIEEEEDDVESEEEVEEIEKEEDDVESEEEVEEIEEEEDSDDESVEELFMVEMEDEDGEVIKYYTNDDENGEIYEVCEDESVGECVGKFKDGEPIITE